MAPLIEEKENTLTLELIQPRDTMLETDEVKLKQILLNLLSNASKFTRQGAITLRVKPSQDQKWLLFEVEDTGIGIPKEQQEHIFEDFVQATSSTTREYGGTGLGLSLCIKLADMLKGHMTLDSVVDVGSTFRFHLPQRTAPEAPQQHPKDTSLKEEWL